MLSPFDFGAESPIQNETCNFAEYEEGKGAKFTRGRGPFKVVFKEVQSSKSAALRREIEIKSMRRSAKCALIGSATPHP